MHHPCSCGLDFWAEAVNDIYAEIHGKFHDVEGNAWKHIRSEGSASPHVHLDSCGTIS